MSPAGDPMALLAADRARAVARGDPLADLCVLATVDAQGSPALRTLVVRGIDARVVQVFLNRSSPKWAELHASGRFELLCYYATLGLQYRLRGVVAEHDLDAVRRSWVRKPYRTKLLDWYYEHERHQSAVLGSREELVAGHRRMQARYPRSGRRAGAGRGAWVSTWWWKGWSVSTSMRPRCMSAARSRCGTESGGRRRSCRDRKTLARSDYAPLRAPPILSWKSRRSAQACRIPMRPASGGTSRRRWASLILPRVSSMSAAKAVDRERSTSTLMKSSSLVAAR